MNKTQLKGDGKTNNAEALNYLLATEEKVVLEKGVYLTGPLDINGSVELVIEKDATLKFISDFELYQPVYSRWEGVKCYCMHPCLFINGAKNVTVRGEGTIDGSGEKWWTTYQQKKGTQRVPVSSIEKKFAALNPGYETQEGGGGGRPIQFLRPALIQIKDSDGVTLEGLTVENSPFWTIHPLFSKNLVLKKLTVKNPADAPNTDGIDVDSCVDVKILDCDVYVGDDGIALKSGSGRDGIADARPTSDVLISRCRVHAAHGGAVIGSETAAGIRNIEVRDCVFDGTDRGIRIKSRRGRGGKLENLVFSNLEMRNNLCPLVVNMYYRCGCMDESAFSLEKLPVGPETPSLKGLKITSCVATGSKASAGMLVGLPEAPLEDVEISDCALEVDPLSSVPASESDMYIGLPEPEGKGLRIRNAEGLKLSNVVVTGAEKGILIEA